MAVTYMKRLEEEPDTYDEKFTNLTKGINLEVFEWILGNLDDDDSSILEVGCGTGKLSANIAHSSKRNVIAIDQNIEMINHAMKEYPTEIEGTLLYQLGSFKDLPVNENSQDMIISTFMISELRPLEQQIFLRNAWQVLKPGGKLIIAAEFVPMSIWRLGFKIKRWRFKKKLRRLKIKSTKLVKYFLDYIEPIGFNIIKKREWKHGSIQVLELVKNHKISSKPGYYKPLQKKYMGISSQLRIYRCTLTGQVDRVPIQPGIYQSGNPNRSSPVLVTANYDFTYIKLMRDLRRIDAWILVLDTDGINVWCAARGDDFGNNQLIEAVEATGIQNYVDHKTLILPQLSAGGISIPKLPKQFPFKIKYGPVWSKYLPNYIDEKPSKKPDYMKLAKFNLYHRIRAGTTHTTFLLRKIFIYPLLLAFIGLISSLYWTNKLTWLVYFLSWIIISNGIIAILFPLSNFTRKFILKGTFFGILNLILLGAITMLFHQSILFTILNLPFIYWVSFFSTMSFSGYTMATAPREIQGEYPTFKKIDKILMIIAIICTIIGILIY
jgi:ubiquinone/menaquinone biosynthesis C-methylase UbiE